jgi:hypothetical protein
MNVGWMAQMSWSCGCVAESVVNPRHASRFMGVKAASSDLRIWQEFLAGMAGDLQRAVSGLTSRRIS